MYVNAYSLNKCEIKSENSTSQFSRTMLRRTSIRLENRESRGTGNIDTTPLNTGSSRVPRIRLLADFSNSDNHTKSSIASSETSTFKTAVKVIEEYSPPIPKDNSFADRFIVPRNKYNMEAAHYLLTRKPDKELPENELDLFKQVKMLDIKWRKEAMHRAMESANVFPGLGQRQVLRHNRLSSENKLPGTLAAQPRALWSEGDFKDGMWKSMPRKKPLVSNAGSILTIPDVHRRSRFSRYLIDWSSKNIIAEAIENEVTVFKATNPQAATRLKDEVGSDVSSLKWNNSGDRLAICTVTSTIKLYNGSNNQLIWTTIPKQVTPYIVRRYVSCICWSNDDKFIVVGYASTTTIYSAKSGQVINSLETPGGIILTIAISSNNRYLVSSSTDKKINIFKWPGMTHMMHVTYRNSAAALAWHPCDGNLLCIGGGWGDASLSLWDMCTANVQSYRLVNFFGAVENLTWNKRSNELVVHWSYWEDENEYAIVPVFASLDRIVDLLPMKKEMRINSLVWNADHTQLGVYSEGCFCVWNFFGDEYQYRHGQMKAKEMKKSTKFKNLNSIHHFVR